MRLKFQIAGTTVTFTIERHPARGDTDQVWCYDVNNAELKLVEERLIFSRLAVGPDGAPVCPKCNSGNVNITPAIVNCLDCSFVILHENYRGPVPQACIVNDLIEREEEAEMDSEEIH